MKKKWLVYMIIYKHFVNVPLGLKTKYALEKEINIRNKPKQSADKNGILIFASLNGVFSNVTHFEKNDKN